MPHFVLLRTQRAVGHGFFHEGVLRAVEGSWFRWIYDCGGGSGTKREVARFVEETKTASVDLLFVSHLHRDHVSGLPDLLSQVKVHRALLPHTSRAERLLLALRCLASGTLRPWLVKFLADPAGWLRENGVDEVIEVVRGGDPAADPRRSDAPADDPVPRLTIFERGAPMPSGTTRVTDEALVVVEHGTLALNFLLYVQPAKLDQVEAFLTALGAGRLSFEEMLKTKAGLRALKQAYQAGWKDINWTSLCVASVPLDANPGNGRGWIEDVGDDFHFRVHMDRPGWLGLGDAVLKEPSEVDALKRHFGGALGQVGLYSIPHHASDDNFCNELMYLCAPATDRHVHILRYATAREGSSKHPSPSVSRTFAEHALRLAVVSENPKTAIRQWLVLER